MSFSDGSARVRYQPPANWTHNGEGGSLIFYPPEKQEAFMKWQLLPRTAPQAASEDFAQWSRGFLPADATEITLVADNASPFVLSGNPSRELIYSYVGGGRRFETAVAVCDLDERQRLAIVVLARARDFKAVHDAAISSLFSWSRRK